MQRRNNRLTVFLVLFAFARLNVLALLDSSKLYRRPGCIRFPQQGGRSILWLSPRDYNQVGNQTKASARSRTTGKVHDKLERKQKRQWQASNRAIPQYAAKKTVVSLKSERKIDIWMADLASDGKFSNPPIFSSWSISDQIEFIKLLQQRGAYESIMLFLDNLGRTHVKVCTTAIFAIALSRIHRGQALKILNRMDQDGAAPTPLTFIALLGSIDGPAATTKMMKRIETYKDVKLNAEVFNSAIYALRRTPPGARPDDSDWQISLNFLQQMRRKHIHPTIKTYHAVLQVLSRTGKVQMAKSLMQQLKSTPNLDADDRVWAAAINVCAQAADHKGAIQLINEMQEVGSSPNLRHCSSLLKAFAKNGQAKMAVLALKMMMEEDIQTHDLGFKLPPTAPDLVALNTVIAACAKAGNHEAATSVFQRIKADEFRDPHTQNVISPDRITYHHVLAACRNPETAKMILKEMRLSRRNRFGAVPPTNVTYARAISVCQKAKIPDLENVDLFLRWAREDAVQPTVFMYSSAIWAAQRCGEGSKALKYFEEMKSLGCHPNSIAYNGVISGLCDSGSLERAMMMYMEAKNRGFHLSGVTSKRLANTIQSIGDADERKSYLEKIFKRMSGEERMVRIGGPIFESLISIYGSEGLFDSALHTFEAIVGPVNAACLRAIVLACGIASPPKWLDAVTILHTSDILEGASGPGKIDQIALSNAIIACSKANEFEEALNLLQLYGIPDTKRSKSSASMSVVAMNSLIAACGRGHRPDLALAAFNEMQSQFGLRPDAKTYRNVVIACNRAEHEFQRSRLTALDATEDSDADSSFHWWECALALLRRMREENITPDPETYSSAISACEAAGNWQRALGVLQMMMDDDVDAGQGKSLLNLYCFNAAISACEKGGAWVEALELYERMLVQGGPIKPNFVTLSSLIVALDKAGQKELAQSMYEEGRKLGILKPWRWTRNHSGQPLLALDLHRFSGAMSRAAIRSTMESYLRLKDPNAGMKNDLVIITGKGLNSARDPILKRIVLKVLDSEYQVSGTIDEANQGRIVVELEMLRGFVCSKSWR